MKFLNKYLRNLSPYKVASHKIWDANENERDGILKLDWNEATVAPSPKVQERLTQLVSQNNFYNLYPSTYDEKLHNLFAEYAGVPKENVQYFASSDALHEYITRVFISVGDPVLILGPTYDNFRLACESQGARVEYSFLSKEFIFNSEQFEKDIDQICPSLVYICNPNNPTGNLVEVSYIEHLLQKYPSSLFLIDEAYYEFSKKSASNLALKYDNILITRTLSKAFALANFRVGYLISSVNNISNISKVRNPKNITTFSQEAAIAVLTDVPYMKNYVEEVLTARADFLNFLNQYNQFMTPVSGEGNFILIRFNETGVRDSFIQFMEGNNILLRNLTHSDLLQNCLRITIGTRNQMNKVCNCVTDFFVNR